MFFLVQPGSCSEIVKSIPRPENHYRIRDIRKSQKVDLIFGDEHFRNRQIKGGESCLCQGDILISFHWQQPNIRVQHPETHA